jgi:hypothetical protein
MLHCDTLRADPRLMSSVQNEFETMPLKAKQLPWPPPVVLSIVCRSVQRLYDPQ